MGLQWIWRVEDECGQGPYSCWMVCSRLRCYGTPVQYRPSPLYYGADHETKVSSLNLYFGFTSPGALKRWFGRYDRRLLSAHGYRVVKILAEVGWEDDRGQVAFIPSSRVDLEKIHLRDI
jgi:hypothetical protein